MEHEKVNFLHEIKKYFQYLRDLDYTLLPRHREFLFDSFVPFLEKGRDFNALIEEISHCSKCSLSRTRRQPVIEKEFHSQKLMIIGEFPSRDDDFYGYPFSGSTGEMLQKMLLSIGLKLKDFYPSLVVKCKPPAGRLPEEEELNTCKSYLFREIALIKPKMILALGNLPPKVFLSKPEPISIIRGRPFKFRESVIIFTYHPNYMLKNPAVKRLIWEDLKTFRKYYENT